MKRRRKRVRKHGANILVLKTTRSKTRRTKASSKKAKGVKPSTVFLYALGVAALGGGAYLIYDRVKRKTKVYDGSSDASDTIIINNNIPASISKSGITQTDSFPLKRGSRGTKVVQLQQALANILGIATMNANGGIDGVFGSGTVNALKLAGYGEVIDQTIFNKLISSGGVQVTFNPSAVASELYKASSNKSISSVLALLKQFNTVSDYSAVNTYYKEFGFISRTVVTDLLDYAFKNDETSRQQIKQEFLRIGLKVSDAGTWSLQGLRLFRDVITMRETFVTDSMNNRIPVNRNTILGDEVNVANGYTWIRSVDNSILKVPTQDVKYA